MMVVVIIIIISSQRSGKTTQYVQINPVYSYLTDCRLSNLGKVANEVAARTVVLGHDVKEKRLHIVVQGLVVQEEFCQQAQVLTVGLYDTSKTHRM